MPANTIIITNNSMEIMDGEVNDPHTGVWVQIDRDPDCLVCGQKVQLSAESSASISLDDLGVSLDEDEQAQ